MCTQPTVLFEKLNLDLSLTARNRLWGQLFTPPPSLQERFCWGGALRDLIYCPQQHLVFLLSFTLCRCRNSYVPSTCTVLVLHWRRETLFSAPNLKELYCESNDPIAKPKCKSNQKMPIASFASLPWPCAIKDITQELWKVHWWEEESTTKRKSPKTKELRRWAYN